MKNDVSKLASFIGLSVSIAFGTFLMINIIYIFATDGWANISGEPETGYASMFAFIILLPIVGICGVIGTICYQKYKKTK